MVPILRHENVVKPVLVVSQQRKRAYLSLIGSLGIPGDFLSSILIISPLTTGYARVCHLRVGVPELRGSFQPLDGVGIRLVPRQPRGQPGAAAQALRDAVARLGVGLALRVIFSASPSRTLDYPIPWHSRSVCINFSSLEGQLHYIKWGWGHQLSDDNPA